MIEGLSDYLGSAYEIVLHSLEDYQHSVISIQNGYHSGRSVGAPITDLALNMLKEIESSGVSSTGIYTSYNVVNKIGEHLKSSTIPIVGDNERIIGILCFNLYLDSPFNEIVESLVGSKNETPTNEYFASNIDETITEVVRGAMDQVMFDSNIPSVKKNKAIIKALFDKDIFNIKNSVSVVANVMNISENTVYMHLRSIKNNPSSD